MFTIINDGDILKLVPRIENGIPIWITRVACVNYLNGTVFLEDKWIHELSLKKYYHLHIL